MWLSVRRGVVRNAFVASPVAALILESMGGDEDHSSLSADHREVMKTRDRSHESREKLAGSGSSVHYLRASEIH
jgi:hypothetical protein